MLPDQNALRQYQLFVPIGMNVRICKCIGAVAPEALPPPPVRRRGGGGGRIDTEHIFGKYYGLGLGQLFHTFSF